MSSRPEPGYANYQEPRTSVKSPLHIDGRTLEGGGQLLRLSLSLSSLLGISLHITDIRGSRSAGGGLKAQHLACVRWLATASNAETEGAELKSKDLKFEPRDTAGHLPGVYQEVDSEDDVFEARVDIGSPGSVGLVIQATLPFIIFRPPTSRPAKEGRSVVRLSITGGTNVSNSPSFEYIQQVLLPTLRLLGLPHIKSWLKKRGWSTGSSTIGAVVFDIPTLRPGEQLSSNGFRILSGMKGADRRVSSINATILAPEAFHEPFSKAIHATVRQEFGYEVEITIDTEESQHAKRVYLILVANVSSQGQELKFGSDELMGGSKGQSPDVIADGMTGRVMKQLAEDVRSGACVDRHMIDQLVVFQALARGESNIGRGVSGTQSLHAETAEWVARKMLGSTMKLGKGHGIGFSSGAGAGPNEEEEAEDVVEEMEHMELE